MSDTRKQSIRQPKELKGKAQANITRILIDERRTLHLLSPAFFNF